MIVDARRGSVLGNAKLGNDRGFHAGVGEDIVELQARRAGTVTLMGSGELTRPMSKVHRWVVSNVQGPVRAVFLDTPAGFEINADDISQRACEYIAEYVRVPCTLVSFKASDRATAREVKNALRKLERANFIFAGPGSPTYAVRNWRDTAVFDLVVSRVAEGAHLVLASAAAIAMGRYTLPVYEIYKVGEKPRWVEGMNLLAPYGLDLAIVSHWNNAEGGTFDTRYCYMGQPRFDALEGLLPKSTVVLGVDEYTACILDLGRDECRVMGAGEVTIRRGGREETYDSGASFSLDHLRSHATVQEDRAPRPVGSDSAKEVASEARESLPRQVAQAGDVLVSVTRGDMDLVAMADAIQDLACAIDTAREARVDESLVSQARDRLRDLLIACSGNLTPSPADEVARLGPFIDLLVDLRSQARADGNWALADGIRNGLSALGIVLEDSHDRTTWRRG
jgi:hypothetical protein